MYSEVNIRAPAKINLGLEVLGRRPDGYHRLRTILQAVSLYDRLRLRRRSRGIRVRCRGLPECGQNNLAWRAAAIFLERSGVRGGLEIDLVKGIPVGGGLGGGSSDAAAVLLGASRLFCVSPTPEKLHEWAADLGSDVPFFLLSGTALGTGRGEIIEPLPPLRRAVRVLIYDPGFEVSTAEVYRRFRRRRLTRKVDKLNILARRWQRGGLGALGKAIFNDLEETVFNLYPRLAYARGRILEQGAKGALLSGSGSCLFGLFPAGGEASRAARVLGAELPGSCRVVHFLPPRQRWGVVKR